MRLTRIILSTFVSVLFLLSVRQVGAERNQEQKIYEEAREIIGNYNGNPQTLQQAAAVLKKILIKNPNSAWGYAGLAMLAHADGYLSGSQYDEEAMARANKFVAKALQIDPNLADACIISASLSLQAKDFKRAIAMASKAEKNQARPDRLDFLWGKIYFEKADYAQARVKAEALISKTQDKHLLESAYILLWKIGQEQNNYPLAEKYLLKCIQLKPQNPWAYVNYSHFLCYRTKQYDQAIEYAVKALSLMDFGMGHTMLAESHRGKGADLWRQNRKEESLGHFQAAVLHDPRNAVAHYSLGSWYYDHGHKTKNRKEIEKAEKEFARALELDPGMKDARNQLDRIRQLIAWLER